MGLFDAAQEGATPTNYETTAGSETAFRCRPGKCVWEVDGSFREVNREKGLKSNKVSEDE